MENKEFSALDAVLEAHASFAREVSVRTSREVSWLSTTLQKMRFWKRDHTSIEVDITDSDKASDEVVKFLRK